MTNLSYYNLLTLVSDVYDSMLKLKIGTNLTLSFELEEDDFRKVDEDLFYHFNEGKNNEYIPSDDKINVSIENIGVVITKKQIK